ncbi:MAG: hypothetical protein AAF754_14940 [Pseudomonadota bacterium]
MSSLLKVSDFLKRRRRAQSPAQIAELPLTTGAEGLLVVPVCTHTAPEHEEMKYHTVGQDLGRQEDWARLAELIAHADAAGLTVSSGTAVSELLAFGARADVLGAFEHVLSGGDDDPDAPVWDGIAALEDVLGEMPDNHAVGAIVALAHMDIAWCWRGDAPQAQIAPRKQATFAQHMDRAATILRTTCAAAPDTPLLAYARMRQHMRPDLDQLTVAERLSQAAMTLFATNPLATQHLRLFGHMLLPRRFGTYARLETEARRNTARLKKTWGSGGYAWIMMDAICNDVEALAGLDVDFFIEGLRDILRRQPDQYTVNLLAAFCAVTMAEGSGDDAADFNRTRIQNCRNWIICEYLHEVHPLVWAHAMRGFDRSIRVRCAERFANRGLIEARRVLKALFLPELARGQNVSFTANGPVTELPRYQKV